MSVSSQKAGNGTAGDIPAVEVVDIHKRFGDLEVLKGISMDAHKGDVISIIGASGSGKSTFLRCINLLELPTKGSISVSGEAIKFKNGPDGNLHPAEPRQVQRLRTKLGMVFQSFNLWQHMNVLQNVIEAPVHVLGRSKAEATEQAEDILQKVGLWDKKDQYPGFLSGGQQQRAAIARAVIGKPELLLADEPTGNVDPQMARRLLRLFIELNRLGTSVLIATHDHQLMRQFKAPRLELHEGNVRIV